MIINEKKLDKTFIKLSKHYDSLVRKYGDNVKSSQQSTSISRDKRLQNLLKNIDIKNKFNFRFWMWHWLFVQLFK